MKKCPSCSSSRIRENFTDINGDRVRLACQRCHYKTYVMKVER